MKSKNKEANLGALIYSMTRRDPSKRQIRPINMDNIMLDDLEDESDDEYVYDGKDDDDASDESNSASDVTGDSREKESDSDDSRDSDCQLQSQSPINNNNDELNSSKGSGPRTLVSEAYAMDDLHMDTVIEAEKRPLASTSLSNRICMLCLGDQNNLSDEIIECDACKIVVHEDCHKVYNDVFLSSSASSSDTDPWFCEPCLAGVENPHCELCPNLGGVFKRTDSNRWVHLLCALYTPGVAFNYSDSLSEITLTELPSKDWSSKECSLCDEKFFAWTGVCISCDAGLCKNYFHVTCAQREGLLAEPAYEDNPSDPFFAQCRQHTDKHVAKARRRNYLTSVNRCKVLRQTLVPDKKGVFSLDAIEDFGGGTAETKNIFSLLDERIQRKLEYFRGLYNLMLSKREMPYTRPTKSPLFLENSPIALRHFMAKAIALSLPLELTGSSAITEASKSTAPGCPVFCPDFISYVLEREKKLDDLAKRLTTLESMQRELQLSDTNVSQNYNSLSTHLTDLNNQLYANRSTAKNYFNSLMVISKEVKATGSLSVILDAPDAAADSRGVLEVAATVAVPAIPATSQKDAVGDRKRHRVSLPLTASRGAPNEGRCRRRATPKAIETILIDVTPPEASADAPPSTAAAPESIFHECSVCSGYRDQHLLTICETCNNAFHIACLDPPLARVPKRSKLFAWQCSACTKAVVVLGETVPVDVNAPRQLRRISASIAASADVFGAPATIEAADTTPIISAVRRRVAPKRRIPIASRARRRTRRCPRRIVAEAYPTTEEDASAAADVVIMSPPKVDPRGDNGAKEDELQVLNENDEEEEAEFTDGEDPSSGTDGSTDSGSSDDDDDVDGDVAEEERVETKDKAETPEHVEVVAVKRRRPSSPEVKSKQAMTSDDDLATLRGSKVKFVRIMDHESPEVSNAEAATKCYVIFRDPSNSSPKKSPAASHFKMKIKKID